jgi:hypothetical protein
MVSGCTARRPRNVPVRFSRSRLLERPSQAHGRYSPPPPTRRVVYNPSSHVAQVAAARSTAPRCPLRGASTRGRRGRSKWTSSAWRCAATRWARVGTTRMSLRIRGACCPMWESACADEYAESQLTTCSTSSVASGTRSWETRGNADALQTAPTAMQVVFDDALVYSCCGNLTVDAGGSRLELCVAECGRRLRPLG